MTGKKVIHVETQIFDGQFAPGFSLTQELMSLKREVTLFVTKVVLIAIANVFLFYLKFSDK